jgi:hypothetical protein
MRAAGRVEAKRAPDASGQNQNRSRWFSLASIRRSAVERVFLDPVEAAADQQELAAVDKVQLQMQFLAVEAAVEQQAVRRRTLVSRIGLPL